MSKRSTIFKISGLVGTRSIINSLIIIIIGKKIAIEILLRFKRVCNANAKFLLTLKIIYVFPNQLVYIIVVFFLISGSRGLIKISVKLRKPNWLIDK